jgi:tetratricopeptide (TPR) repeat protein
LVTEAERSKPRAVLAEEAIQLALDSRWKEAASVNELILERHGPDEDAYNRLGKALSELGRVQEALDAYQKTLELNPLNVSAQKNTRRLAALAEAPDKLGTAQAAIDVDLFTEEPGKSALTMLSPPHGGVGVTVTAGDAVELQPEGTALVARTARGVVLGGVDTKIARRLMPLMTTGNRYSAAVARVDDSRIEIMIREVYQAPENARKTSFPIARGARRDEFRPYAKESLLSAREADIEPLDEEDEEALADTNAGGDDDLEGMQTVEGELDEVAVEPDDEPDEDVRPEDHY